MSNISGLRECWSDSVLNKITPNITDDSDLNVHHLTNSLESRFFAKTDEQYSVTPSNDIIIDDVEETIYLDECEPKRANVVEEEVDSDFDVLPEELIIQILSYIPLKELYQNVVLVCKRWKDLALSPILWQYLDLDVTTYLTSQCLTNIICKHCSLLKRLNLRNQDQLCDEEILAIARACPLLYDLTLSFCGEVVKTAKIFAKHCVNLHYLNMEGCDVTDDCLKHLANLPLKGLNVSHCIHISDEGMKSVTSKCCNLMEINFDGVQWITDDAVFVMVQNCYQKLEKLWLDGDNLTDASVKAIAKCKNLNCPNLITLNLSWCWDITDHGLRHIILNCRQMERLNICGLTDVQGECLLGLPELMPKLVYLNASQCNSMSDEVLLDLVDTVPNINVIDYYNEVLQPRLRRSLQDSCVHENESED